MNLDAELTNADWTKKTWDLPTRAVVSWVRQATKAQVRAFARLPAYRAAPPSVVEAVEARLET